jgi:hypothetical protein
MSKPVQPKPCRTCGKKPKLWLEAWNPKAVVACSDRLCPEPPAPGDTHLLAIESWNDVGRPSR